MTRARDQFSVENAPLFRKQASRDTLQREYDRNELRIAELQRRQEVLRERLDKLRKREASGMELTPEGWRDAMVAMRSGFTIPELAAKMGVGEGTARPHVLQWVAEGRLRSTGKRFQRAMIYEYVEPEAGAAFVKQQEHRKTLERPEDVALRTAASPVEGTGASLKGVPKDAKPIVAEALLDGWKLNKMGNGHWALVKNGQKVQFASSPRDATIVQNYIRQNIAKAERRMRTT